VNRKGDFEDGGPFKGGVIDFAGSGIVHMVGGMAGLVGAYVMEPRIGRFDGEGKPVCLPGHSSVLAVLGTLILWVGWFGFNPGSTLGLVGKGADMARVTVTTTISGSMGGLTVLMLDKCFGSKTWDVAMVCNGVLAGLVSITAGCSVTMTWAAFLIGWLGGIFYFIASQTVLNKCKVDDPLDAFAVHGVSGMWGIISASLLAFPGNGYQCGKGAFYGGSDCFQAALAFVACTCTWTISLCFIMFLGLKKGGVLRVPAAVEEAGMDISKHGGSAYNGLAHLGGGAGGKHAAPVSTTA